MMRQLCVPAVASETGDPISGFELSEFRLVVLLRAGVPLLFRSLRTWSSKMFWSAILLRELREPHEMEKRNKRNVWYLFLFSNTAY